VNARSLASERGLVAEAVRHLTTDALGQLPFEALGPTKALLKRFFSVQPWTASDDEALADAVGPGQGWWRHPLDHDLVLGFGWVHGRFALEVTATGPSEDLPDEHLPDEHLPDEGQPPVLGFDGPVTPEATPNPRTVMFHTGVIHHGQSRSYTAGESVEDASVARLLQGFADIGGVMVAGDFVAVTLRRADRWEALLAPVLQVVTEEFAGEGGGSGDAHVKAVDEAHSPTEPFAAPVRRPRPADRRQSRLERAWQELGSLRPGSDGDLERIRAAASGEDPARRQVAANLLREADPEVARAEWSHLVADDSRLVRRAALDAMVDVGREELRGLLEGAMDDDDAWLRWKAVRGLSELGLSEPGAVASREAIENLMSDRDFRVRQEAQRALERNLTAPR